MASTTSPRSSAKATNGAQGSLFGSRSHSEKSASGALASANQQRLHQMIEMLLLQGGMVSFSLTSDQGAMCMYFRLNNASAKEYARSSTEVDEIVEITIEGLEAL